MIGAMALFSIYSGGDWMPGFRFFIPVAPLLVMFGVLGLSVMLARIDIRPDTASGGKIFLWVTIISLSSVLMQRVLLRGELQMNSDGLTSGFRSVVGFSITDHKELSDWLGAHAHPGDLFATGEAGMIGYLNPSLILLDMNGLIDKKIAQDRKNGRAFDCEYVLHRSPRFVFIDRSAQAISQNNFYTQLYNYPSFMKTYEKAERIGAAEIYKRRDSAVVVR
jgi:hypothetical protein